MTPHYLIKADSAASNGFRKRGLDPRMLVSFLGLTEVTVRDKVLSLSLNPL